MLRFILKEKDGKERAVVFEKDVVRIGKSSTNDFALPEPAVSRRHAIVRRTGDKVLIEDLVSTNGTFVNGMRISGPQEITMRDRIFIAGYTLQLDMLTSQEEITPPTEEFKKPESQPEFEEKTALEAQIDEASRELPDESLKTIALTEKEVEEWTKSSQELDSLLREKKEPRVIEPSEAEEEIPIIPLRDEDVLEAREPEPSQIDWDVSTEEMEIPPLGMGVEEEKGMLAADQEELASVAPSEEEEPLLRHPEEVVSTGPQVVAPVVSPPEKAAPSEAEIGSLASLIYRRLTEQPELYWRFLEPGQDISNRQIAFLNAIRSLIAEMDIEIPPGVSREELIQLIMEETVLPGIVEHLMADPEINCILINGKDRVFIERYGKIEPTEYRFSCDEAVMAVASWMLVPVGKHVDYTSPIVNARLENGSEIHVIIPPLAHSGPCVTIRKPGGMPFTMADLIEKESLSREMAQFLKISVENGINILITGAQGSGKTTLLRTLASLIPEEERIITIEDWPELKLQQENMVVLLTRPPDFSGQGAVSAMDLVRSALQMRPDRLLLGGCSSEEVMEILQASRGGIRGVLAALHANSPQQALSQLALSAGLGKPPSVVLPWIASMVDLIVHCVCMTDGRRKVMRICEVADSQDEPSGLRDIFRFESSGFDRETSFLGRFVPQNVVPRFIEEIEMRGVAVDREMFQKP